MIPRIVWLASYPKSGNTWMRIFLANLKDGSADPIDINDLRKQAGISLRPSLDGVLGFDTGDLSPEESALLRPVVYRWINNSLTEQIYAKTHDACDSLSNGDWLMAPDVTDRVVYILRNPLDVAVSMAHHNQKTIDATIEQLGNPDATLARHKPTRQAEQVEQRMGTWSTHVQSWTQNKLFNTLVVRYEDLNAKPHETFAKVTAFLGLPHNKEQRDIAIKNASFDALQTQEAASGFRERPQKVDRFFRKGKIGDWQTALSRPQIDKVVQDHLTVMQQFGYANPDGTPRLA